MDSLHRPRNVDWQRAAALLYGDWGTSKAYVIGLAFVAAQFSSLPIILAVCVLTGVVGYNYIIICRSFPDGGGVYSAARDQSRLLAAIGALLLIANFIVTAAISGWAAITYLGYLGFGREYVAVVTMALIAIVGMVNFFGPKHSGSVALFLAIPMVVVIILLIAFSVPYLSLENLEPSHASFRKNWVALVGVILALSGVEAVANLTGVMKLDPGSTLDEPRVGKTARKAILPVALEVVIGTSLLGWAMLSLPHALHKSKAEVAPTLFEHYEDMLRYLGEQYGTLVLGPTFGLFFGLMVGIVAGLLLISAVNTALAANIGLMYMLARDGEMPRAFAQTNGFGVPKVPLLLATLLPLVVVAFSNDINSLAGLYAIGVVGAITVNLGSCTFNPKLKLAWYERGLMTVTFLTLFAVELTIAKTKNDALFFALCVLIIGLALRSYAQRRSGLRTLTVSHEVAAAVAPESFARMALHLEPGQTILVAARGVTPVLRFGVEEARLRRASLYILYVRELAISFPGPVHETQRPKWQDDPRAAEIMYGMLELGRQNDVSVVPLYAVSENPAATILDLAATLGVDMLMLGTSHRSALTHLLKGNVVTEVARNLPENIQLILYG